MFNESDEPSLRILLIEDGEDDTLILRHLLERMDWTPFETQRFELKRVDSYEEGLNELQCGAHDIALIDYHLGMDNGVELLLEARTLQCHVPIVILTGQGDHNIDMAAMRAGAAEYLEKDKLSESLLEHILRYALAHGRSQAALRHAASTSRQLAFNNNLLAAAVSNLSDGVIITDPKQSDNPIIFANAAFCLLTGYSEAEILGRSCRFLQGPETDLAEVQRIREAIEQQRPYSGVLLNYRKNGSDFWNGLKISPVFDENGELVNFVGMQADITPRKMAEENVHFQARLLETVGQAVIATNLHGVITYMNGSAAQLFGWSKQEAVGKRIGDLVVPESSREQASFVMEKLQRGQGWAGEMIVHHRNGTVFPIAITNAPILDDAGNLLGIVGVSEDITQRKQDEQAVRDSEARFQSIVANTPGMVYQFLLHADGTYELPFVSEGCRELLEREPESIQGIPNVEINIFDDSSRLEYNRSIAVSASTLLPWEWQGRLQVPSGKIKWVQGNSRPERLTNGDILWDGLLMDITQSKRAQTLLSDQSHALEMVARGLPLKQTLDHLCHLMENQLDGALCSVLILDEDGLTLRHGAGPSLPDDFNQSIDGSVIGPRAGSCGTAVFLGEPVIVTDISKSALWSDYPQLQQLAAVYHLKACWSHPIFDANRAVIGSFALYLREASSPQAEEWHFLEQTTDIAAIALERQKAEAALRRSNNELERRVAERTAQLERAKVEAENASVQAEQLRREADVANAAKSEFLSRMSHELRTPLNAILGFGQILEMRSLGAKESEGVSQILRGGRHLLNLINEVLDIAKVEAGRLELSIEAVPLADTVGEICALVKPLATERNIFLSEDMEDLRPYHVLADSQKLKQILLNLLSNAIKYNRPQGTVHITAARTVDGRMRLSVHDTGPGIAPEDMPKLFVPFERLGAVNSNVEGTGLGLILSRRLVEAMNGKLEVESVPGKGCVFSFDLPEAHAASEGSLPNPKGGDTLTPVNGNYSILCIEDNLSNLRLIETIIEERPNITLLAAMQGSVGLDLARQHKPDLILLDLNLPDMDGKEILVRLKQSLVTSNIPVVVISADATPIQRQFLLNGGAHFYLTKPIDVSLFLRTLDDVLQAKANW